MITPYYSDDHVTIYHGDCLDLLAGIEADVVITDPPYGIGLDTARTGRQPKRSKDGRLRTGRDHLAIAGDDQPFDPAPFLARWPCLFTGANHFAAKLPITGRWHVWDKTDGGRHPAGLGNDFELIWTSYPSGRSRVYNIPWAGLDRVNRHPDSFNHPSQKPIALMAQLLDAAPAGVALDPYMGSGTTLRAAKDLGRRAIGIEIEERYCEIAALRCAQEVLAFG